MISRRALFVFAIIGAIVVAVWRSQLFTVSAPGEVAEPLRLLAPGDRVAFTGDVVLPIVPVGMQHLHPDGGVMVIHYWAPWESGSLEQARMLDSLRHTPGLETLQAWLVTFDPFPSVARYVGRNRLTVPVLMDGHRELRRALPCPSIPYTYVIDADGTIVVAQAGRIDWLAEEGRGVLRALLEEVGHDAEPEEGRTSGRFRSPVPIQPAGVAAPAGARAARAARNTPVRITSDPAI
jgi:hypothetical protein